MSDQALAWKAGFGALVLVFCAASWWARKPADVSRATQPQAVASQPGLPTRPQAREPAPLDVQEDTPPVRVEVTLHDAEPEGVRPQPHLKTRRPAPQMLDAAKPRAPRLHNVAARRKASPYAVGRKHYPVGPGERWAMREAP